MGKAKIVAYWLTTGVVAWEMTAGALWDLLQIEFVRGVFTRLGYPHWLLFIIGVWKLPCALALMLPRLTVAKEWAYAGAIFLYTGAAASHALGQDATSTIVGPAVFAGMAMASWALRPADRRAPGATTPATLRAWLAPTGVVAAFAAMALATLPKGPPPP